MLDVKHLAEHCGFGEFKDRAIRDVLVIGINDRKLQKRLFDEDDLSVAKAEKMIVNQELSLDRTQFLRTDDNRRSNVVARLGRKPDRVQRRSNFRNRSRSRSRSFSRNRSGNRYDDRSNASGREFLCSYCKKKGHIRKYCYKLRNNSPRKPKSSVKFVDSPKPKLSEPSTSGLFKRLKEDMQTDSEDESPCLLISAVNKINTPCYVDLKIQNKRITMEIDCGSAESVISESLFLRNFKSIPVKACNKNLVVIDGKKLKVLGKVEVSVQLGESYGKLSLVILRCENDFVPLMGRTWLDIFYAGWRDVFVRPTTTTDYIKAINDDDKVTDLKSKFPKVFDGDLSNPIIGYKGDLVLKDNTPIFRKAYEVPLRLRQKVLEHLDGLEKDGIITPIDASEWASPVVVVIKKNQDIRLVIDCKVTINKVIVPNTYPLPLAQDLFATLAGSKVFCSLDLTGAYTQLLLSDRSKKIMIINTIKGLYAYNRLPQGASSSASIFQKVMDQVLQGLENVSCYLDDVLISGKDMEDCKNKLYLVLERPILK